MTPEAKSALSAAVRRLRVRLLDDLAGSTEAAYRFSVRARDAGLREAAQARRARLEAWLEDQLRAERGGRNGRDRTHFLRAAEKRAAYTLLNRLVLLRLMEGMGLRKLAVLSGGWDSEGYRNFREIAPALVRGDESEGYAYLLELVFEELALELPGLYGSNGVADLIPVGPATLRHLVESLDDPALAGCWTDDMTLGWVYQYWNDPEREALDAKLHAGGKVEPPEIASKTRMFTERYMVDWLLQNSLGPMWLAMSLAHDGIGIDHAWSQLSGVPDFRGITDEEFFRLVGWMRGEQSMLLLGGRLVVGPKIERTFGRRNFMDLYSVFSSPQSYAVRTTHGQPLGSLNQDFVDRLVDEVSCFLLSGRAGAVVRFQHSERQVIVEAAPRGRQPTWGGFLPQFLSHTLCQRILAVLTSTEDYPYLSQPARDALAVKRDEVHDILEPCIGDIEVDDGEIRWWTYAGGTINSTLRHAIAAIEPDWKITADNLLVRLRGEGVNGRYFSEALRQLGSAGFWEDTELWQVISRNLPGYRLSEFQPLMPSWVERETLERYLLDLDGTRRWLARSSASHDEMVK